MNSENAKHAHATLREISGKVGLPLVHKNDLHVADLLLLGNPLFPDNEAFLWAVRSSGTDIAPGWSLDGAVVFLLAQSHWGEHSHRYVVKPDGTYREIGLDGLEAWFDKHNPHPVTKMLDLALEDPERWYRADLQVFANTDLREVARNNHRSVNRALREFAVKGRVAR